MDCMQKRAHMHDVPATIDEVLESYRETLESRRRSRAREYSHIPFDWHKDTLPFGEEQEDKDVVAPAETTGAGLGSMQQQQQQQQQQDQQQEQADAAAPVFVKPPPLDIPEVAKATTASVKAPRAGAQRHVDIKTEDGHDAEEKPSAKSRHIRMQQEQQRQQQQKPAQQRKIKVRREVTAPPPAPRSSTAERLYNLSKAKQAAEPSQPSRRNYFGYKPPAPKKENVRVRTEKPKKKRPPFAHYGWNNDQIGAWKNKKTFNVRASKEVDVHALHAALDRGYMERLPRHAQKEWAKPLHTHPFDYDAYERESGRHGEASGQQVAVRGGPRVSQSSRNAQPSAAQVTSASAASQKRNMGVGQARAHATGARRSQHRAVQYSPPVEDEQHQQHQHQQQPMHVAGGDDVTEPLEQHALTVTFESDACRDEVVQTDSSFLHCEDESTQTRGGNIRTASGHHGHEQRVRQPQQRQHHAPARVQSTPTRGGSARQQHQEPQEPALSTEQQRLVEALRRIDMRQRATAEKIQSEYQRAYGGWLQHAQQMQAQHVSQAQQRGGVAAPTADDSMGSQRTVVLGAHKPQVVHRRVAPSYSFRAREEEDAYRVHYGATYTHDC